MKKRHQETQSPFQSLENHFLNVFHAGVYISGQELVNVGKQHGFDIPMKNRELVIKNLLNTANDNGKLSEVVADISALIHERIKLLNGYASDYPHAANYLQSLIQRATSTDLLLKRQQRANPYE